MDTRPGARREPAHGRGSAGRARRARLPARCSPSCGCPATARPRSAPTCGRRPNRSTARSSGAWPRWPGPPAWSWARAASPSWTGGKLFNTAVVYRPATCCCGTGGTGADRMLGGSRVIAPDPFMSTTLYTGPATTAMNGTDLSWIVGLVVTVPLSTCSPSARSRGGRLRHRAGQKVTVARCEVRW